MTAITKAPEGDNTRVHLLTIGLEDYFQVDAFDSMVAPAHWYRFESRLEHGLQRTLELLDEASSTRRDGGRVTATFFILGWVAERYPELVRSIAEHGHEVASSGFEHRRLATFTPSQFRDDLARTREALERAVRHRIHGHRVAGWMSDRHLWALDVLAESGYTYDSSLRAIRFAASRAARRSEAHEHRFGARTIWEYPVSALRMAGTLIPAAGGNFLRQFPAPLLHRAIARWEARTAAPFVFYFHTWELDPDQPRFHHAPFVSRLRHYRNLDRMRDRIGDYLTRYRFSSVAEARQLARVDRRHTVRPARRALVVNTVGMPNEAPVPSAATARTTVTVVIPCYNEVPALRYLGNTLESVERALAARFDLRFQFVDDGSSDGTFAALNELARGRPHYRVLRQRTNGGVTAAILAGIRAADTEIVASMDCDCTYDPHELGCMIPLLSDGVALVTASPYHPLGSVHGVPRWRLGASKTLSWLYRRVLRHKLHTYTSCFRVYRRSVVANLQLTRGGFLGVAEMVARLDERSARGTGRIVEYPTTLSARVVGRSKMRVLRVALAHLTLLAAVAVKRWLPERGHANAANGAAHA
ncbi:MAG: DUF3473 domain-containing protein [Gemmatimonadota bacterium]